MQARSHPATAGAGGAEPTAGGGGEQGSPLPSARSRGLVCGPGRDTCTHGQGRAGQAGGGELGSVALEPRGGAPLRPVHFSGVRKCLQMQGSHRVQRPSERPKAGGRVCFRGGGGAQAGRGLLSACLAWKFTGPCSLDEQLNRSRGGRTMRVLYAQCLCHRVHGTSREHKTRGPGRCHAPEARRTGGRCGLQGSQRPRNPAVHRPGHVQWLM